MSNPAQPICIIGSGLAAYTLIREYRKINAEHPITLVTQEAGDFYSKPMLSTAIAGQKSAEQLVTSPATKMAEQFNLVIHTCSKPLKTFVLILGSLESFTFSNLAMRSPCSSHNTQPWQSVA